MSGIVGCFHDCAQALSKRIHYGKFVAEAKFRAQPQEYSELIRAQDADGLMALLTDEAVEAKVIFPSHSFRFVEAPGFHPDPNTCQDLGLHVALCC